MRLNEYFVNTFIINLIDNRQVLCHVAVAGLVLSVVLSNRFKFGTNIALPVLAYINTETKSKQRGC